MLLFEKVFCKVRILSLACVITGVFFASDMEWLSVCPVYFFLHSVQVSWYTPFLLYLLSRLSMLSFSNVLMLFLVENEIPMSKGLNSFVMYLVLRPI